MEFETARLEARSAWLAILAAWTEEWPTRFVETAAEAALTRLSFRRRECPPALAAAVARLPPGEHRRRAPWSSILKDATMRRLRRRDKAAWRALHAKRALLNRAVSPSEP